MNTIRELDNLLTALGLPMDRQGATQAVHHSIESRRALVTQSLRSRFPGRSIPDPSSEIRKRPQRADRGGPYAWATMLAGPLAALVALHVIGWW